MDELPLVLLGLRSAPKEDLGCLPSELVYGTTVHLPREFVSASTTESEPPASNLLTQLHTTMATLRMTKADFPSPPTDLTCTCGVTELQVRHDAHCTPLQCTYNGRFRVLEQAVKYFTLDLHGKRDTVSVDRLKPAFLDAHWGMREDSAPMPATPSTSSAVKNAISP